MILENVTTGEVKHVTEGFLEEKRAWRKLVTQPNETSL